ncbi:calpain-A [Trichonephila clavipes]|nr:calpain-A [Trichonephila clavipes]
MACDFSTLIAILKYVEVVLHSFNSVIELDTLGVAFLGFWTVKTVLNPISGQVFDEGHGDSGVLLSARWHDGDWLIDGIREAWLRCFVWMNVFKQYDIDHSGSLNTIELRAALHSAGYRLNFHVLRALVLRYGKKGKINFDDFIMCAVKLKTMIETFQERDPRKTLMATFTLDEWVEKTMYS